MLANNIAPGISISVASGKTLGDKFEAMLAAADKNGDGVIDINEIVEIMEEMLSERSSKRMYRFMAFSALVVVTVLLGALTGIVFGIVQLTKDTKVTSLHNTTYQFLQTKDGRAAVMGGAALDLRNITDRPDGVASRRRLLAERQRRLAEDPASDANADFWDAWIYYGTTSFETVAAGCEMLQQNVVEFPVATPKNAIFVNGLSVSVVKVIDHTGCDTNDARLVSALVLCEDGYTYLVACDEAIGGCDLYQNMVPDQNAVASATQGARRRLLRAHTPMPGAAGGYSLAATRGHFVPVCVGRCSDEELAAGAAVLENRRAGDVQAGDLIAVVAGGNVTPSRALSLATVTHVDLASSRGAFNPYVRGADLLVDGVLASPHSEWLLDWLAPAGLVPYLPYIYEVLLAPVYGLYGMVGPSVAEWLAHGGLHLADVGTASEYGIGYFAVLAGMMVPLAAALATLRPSRICGWRP
ncbi:hypothetical protein GPECTOR_16g549 [Gonium pectorale]|uniref:EF-hand domain-containing protein n=1 Tax=Gonium pectorale TaxID=33097 RepID=A0A150GKJ5_GONPE|nr:hypothetical protein GPECTOR_16g549 [Gonium pectorale]|eukprot:KXZ50376.1 hypothetical protein GPECTOR_16g549 [Gonium pectorale]